MTRTEIQAALEAIVEDLAAQEHARWAHWQRYMHEQGEPSADGALILPAELVQRWESQIGRSYAELSDAEKESDREQVRRYLPAIVAALAED